MSICIIGDSRDLTATYLGWCASRRRLDVLALDESEMGERWTFCGTDPDGSVRVAVYALERTPVDIAGAYVRLHPWPRVRGARRMGRAAETLMRVERRSAIQALLGLLPVVANPPHAGRSNASKPLQMFELARAHFLVPEWVVTNVRRTAEDLAARSPRGVVVKAASGLRGEVRRLSLMHLTALERGSAPVVLQRYIAGYDVRVHVVGEEVFGTAIRSGAIDYRYKRGARFERSSVPEFIARQCVAYARQEGLLIGGFDFRVDSEGRWWCLEVNPLPTFLPYEAATGQPIADALLDLFIRLSTKRRH